MCEVLGKNLKKLMFTIDQIKAAHAKVKNGQDFPKYVQELLKLGVTSYECYVADGHTLYFGNENFKVLSDPKYATLHVADLSNVGQFIKDLKNHQQGNTNYPTFCIDCSKSGVEKWIVNTIKMTCAYYDKLGNVILVEHIPCE